MKIHATLIPVTLSGEQRTEKPIVFYESILSNLCKKSAVIGFFVSIFFSLFLHTVFLYFCALKLPLMKFLHYLGVCIVTANEISLTSTATSTDDESQNNLQPDDPSLDYIMNDDGSCQCKLCGEKVASRTHWYRHKYKVHNVALFRCEKCEIFFKSKKGYEGHIANKHAPKIIGTDGKPKTKKDVEGLNKVSKVIKIFCNLLTSTITFNTKVNAFSKISFFTRIW